MTPACPSSRATVADGCAPTDSQYLRRQEQQQEISAAVTAPAQRKLAATARPAA